MLGEVVMNLAMGFYLPDTESTFVRLCRRVIMRVQHAAPSIGFETTRCISQQRSGRAPGLTRRTQTRVATV